jgi:hypothetical protein
MPLTLEKEWKDHLKRISEKRRMAREAKNQIDEGFKRAQHHPDRSQGMDIKISAWRQIIEGQKKGDEASRIGIDANLAWIEAIENAFGEITVTWQRHSAGTNCILENGEFYEDDGSIYLL